MIRPIRIATFNAENFSLITDKPYTREELEALDSAAYLGMNPSIYNPNKERNKIAEIARIIEEDTFDIIGLCEIGGRETLEAFIRTYLHDKWDYFIHEENSRRGIFVAAIARKGRFPSIRAKNVSGDFSRNLLQLSLGPEGGNLTVFVVHLKSQRGEDRGIGMRLSEIDRLASIIPHKKCVILGDFNGILIRGQHQFEYEQFLSLPITDVLAAVGIPPPQRRTHYYFSDGPHFTQLDYIFCTHDIEVLDAAVLEDAIPRNRDERFRLPSDHLFLTATIQPECEE